MEDPAIVKMRNAFNEMSNLGAQIFSISSDYKGNPEIGKALGRVSDNIQVSVMEAFQILDLPSPGAGDIETVLHLNQVIRDNASYGLELIKMDTD